MLKKRCLARDENRLNKTIEARDEYYQEHSIKKYSKKATWTPEREWFKKQLELES
ncbi:MAG TPA: hypothetical protein VKM55_15485 [Candidatus Lokiarchaeia archaeon]|nr:hypothetical protein [Candidatus Lokiarchaeia archaeon]